MAVSKYTCRLLAYTITATNLGSCADSYMKSATRNKTTALIELTATVDAAGNVTAAFDSTSKSVQVLRLSTGPLSGSGAAFPPGSLAFPVSISVGAGETLASTDFGQQLGIDSNPITAAGPSVSFMPSTNIQASSPFTLSIPFSATSLTLAANSSNDNLIVLYRWMKVENDVVTYAMGIIPRSEVIISDSKVSFQTKKFGSFQIGISETKISAAVTAPTAEPPSMKADVSNPLVGNWGVCREEKIYTAGGPAQSNTSTPPTPMTRGLGFPTGITAAVSASSMNNPSSVSFDGTRLFVADTANNRILVWNHLPLTPSQPADYALGQANPTSYAAGTSPSQLNAPQGVFSDGTKLFVADTGNNRVLLWSTIPTQSGQAASRVLGQTSFSSNTAGPPAATTFNGPSAVYSTPGNPGKLFVADTANNRVLIWNTPITSNGQPANVVVGQVNPTSTDYETVSVISMNQPRGITVNSGKLVVADSGNNRVLVYDGIPTTAASASAIAIIGQTSDTDHLPNGNSAVSDAVMSNPLGVFSLGPQLYVADSNNHRLLVWDQLPTSPPTTPPTTTYGGPANRVLGQPSGGANANLDRSLAYPSGIFAGGGRVFVADKGHHRVVAWDHLPTTNFDLMDFGLGQPNLPNWNQGNTAPAAPYCTTGNLSVSMRVQSDKDLPHAMTVSIDGAAPVPDHGLPFAAGSSGITSVPVFSMPGPNNHNKSLTLWAPPSCMFSKPAPPPFGNLTSPAVTFPALTLHPGMFPTNAACTANVGDLTLVCSAPPGDGGGGGGGDAIGRIPGTPYSAYEFVKITSGTFNHIKRIYQSRNCTGALTSTINESGSYSLPPADVTGTIPIDLTVANKTAKIMTAAGIERANAEPQWNGCGFSDWVINSPKSLNNSECEKDAGVDHTRIKIEGTKMFFCDNRINGTRQNSSGAARPADCNNIDTSGYLIKE